MTDAKDILSINALFDIRAETLAAALLSASVEPVDVEQMVIAPVGAAHRRSRHEVKSIRKKHYEQESVFFIEVHRKGLFDTLPEGLFLKANEESSNAIERSKAFQEQSLTARKFFLPFEQAMYLPRIEMEQMEQEWTEHFPGFMERIWGLPAYDDCLNKRQRFLLAYLLPEAYRAAGNWELTGLCFEAVLQRPVDLRLTAPLVHAVSESLQAETGFELGSEVILGASFRDDVPALEVSIKGVTVMDLPDFMEGGTTRRILEELLYAYFLPLDVPVLTHIIVTDDAWEFTLGASYLGYNVELQQFVRTAPDSGFAQTAAQHFTTV
jgi:hypothetical protein